MLNLRGECGDPLQLTGKAIDAEASLAAWISAGNRAALSVYWYGKLTLYTLFNENSLGLHASNTFKKYKDAQQGVIINRYAVFNDTINRLFLYSEASIIKKLQYRIQIKISQMIMKRWADSAPTNNLHMFLAGEALYAWLVRGDMDTAEYNFTSAIQLCRKYRDVLHAAVFTE